MDVLKEILSQEKLREWAHLTMEERAAKLSNPPYNIVMSRQALSKYFKRYGVRYRAIGFKWPIKNIDEIICRRKEFIFKIEEHKRNGRSFAWFDETSVNPWMFKCKVWQSIYDPFVHRLPTT